jgi:hypothetical protein
VRKRRRRTWRRLRRGETVTVTVMEAEAEGEEVTESRHHTFLSQQ